MGATSVTESHISGLIDTIVVLRHVETRSELRRGLLVLKMRGSEHDKTVREYSITSNGLSIDAPMERVAGFIPGAARLSSAP
jgi:circadian clock protein KaiC